MSKVFFKTDQYDSFDENGIATKVEVDDFLENGKHKRTFRVYKTQDTTALEKKNELERASFTGFKGDMCKTHSIPLNLYWDMIGKGINPRDVKEQINYIELHYPKFSSTTAQLSKKRIII